MKPERLTVDDRSIPIRRFDTLVVGSGAAGLKCAVSLDRYDQKDIAVLTEGIGAGTSYNSGSDKQTYYKISTVSKAGDSPYSMARALYDGGGMHGDIALTEATGSAEAFFDLVSLGVDFPRNRYGGFVGYKTDHDPQQRGTSVGPYTSRNMVTALSREVERRGIETLDGYEVVKLLRAENRIVGAVAVDLSKAGTETFGLTVFLCRNLVFAVGGPGGIYERVVYPEGHRGAIGLAIEAGAEAVNLTESQYGLASTAFRWNVSGSYQQCIPRYVSGDESSGDAHREFLDASFPGMTELSAAIFRKGYQWPFDPRKIAAFGSSLVDVLVYLETRRPGRRVFLDYTRNLSGNEHTGPFTTDKLDPEAFEYLEKSGALQSTPIERLRAMNPAAISLYLDHGIDIGKEPLEIAVCAQHCNGGLAGDLWWQSTNIGGLFPIGEVNGSHGVYRPGGSALNSGQVGAERAARWIAYGPRVDPPNKTQQMNTATEGVQELIRMAQRMLDRGAGGRSVDSYVSEFQNRMSTYGAHIRSRSDIANAASDAAEQTAAFDTIGVQTRETVIAGWRARHLVLAHQAYLEAIRFYIERGGGSRGSYLVLDEDGDDPPEGVPSDWRVVPESEELRDFLIVTQRGASGAFGSELRPRRPVPDEDFWFETVWKEYREGSVYY